MFKKRPKPNPFVITFDNEADGGPVHVLWTLTDFCVRLRKNGKDIVDGLVIGVNDDDLVLRIWNERSKEYDGPIKAYPIWDGTFDEVMYL